MNATGFDELVAHIAQKPPFNVMSLRPFDVDIQPYDQLNCN